MFLVLEEKNVNECLGLGNAGLFVKGQWIGFPHEVYNSTND